MNYIKNVIFGGLSSLAIVANSYAISITQDFSVTFDFVDVASIDEYIGFSQFGSILTGSSVNGTVVYDADLDSYFTNSATGENFIGSVDVTLNLGSTYTETDDIDYEIIPTAPDVVVINDIFSSLLYIVESTELDNNNAPIWEFSIDGDIFELADTRLSSYDLLATGNVSYITVASDAVLPIPASVWLMGTGLLVIASVGRRKK